MPRLRLSVAAMGWIPLGYLRECYSLKYPIGNGTKKMTEPTRWRGQFFWQHAESDDQRAARRLRLIFFALLPCTIPFLRYFTPCPSYPTLVHYPTHPSSQAVPAAR